MSQKEFQRVKVIENAVAGRLSVGRVLQLSERRIQRLNRRYQRDSIDWGQHGNRGRPPDTPSTPLRGPALTGVP